MVSSFNYFKIQEYLFKYITVAAFSIYAQRGEDGAGEVGGHALNSHGTYIVDHGKSWKNHGIVFLNFCGNPVKLCFHFYFQIAKQNNNQQSSQKRVKFELKNTKICSIV